MLRRQNTKYYFVADSSTEMYRKYNSPVDITIKTLLSTFLDLIFCAKAPPVKCQLIDVIEETDPYKRVLEPAFIKTKKCAGGIKVPSRYQCQPIRTQKEEFQLFDTHSLAYVTKVKHVPVACGEFCICHTGCGGEKPRDGICEPGLK